VDVYENSLVPMNIGVHIINHKRNFKQNEMNIKDLISKNTAKFDEWDIKLKSHIDITYNREIFSEKEQIDIFYQTNQLLIEIAKNFYEYGKFKDTWNDFKCSLDIYGQTIYLKSIKTGIDFKWGVYQNCFFLESYIHYPENLKYMNDDFWRLILDLSEYGEFSFVENCGIGSEEKHYFNNKKSNLFRLMRNYIITDIEIYKSAKEKSISLIELGWLETKWKFGTDWKILIENSCRVFKILYSLNYQLWKISDLKKKTYARQSSRLPHL